MRIAVAAEAKRVSEHFGHCEGFMMYEADGGNVDAGRFLPNPGHQPGVLPIFLKENGADVVIAGGMGERAQTLFAQQGIKVIVGASGSCDDAARLFAAGQMVSTESVCSKHEHAHECGGH